MAGVFQMFWYFGRQMLTASFMQYISESSIITLVAGFGNLKKTQERLQSILEHIDTITNVDESKKVTARSQFETINKFKELLHTLEQLQPATLTNMPGCPALLNIRCETS